VRTGAGDDFAGQDPVRPSRKSRPQDGDLGHQHRDARDTSDKDARRWDLHEESEHEHGGEDELHDIEHREDKTPDAKPDGNRDPRRTELQGRFEERNREHHAEPHEGHGACE
jgi:hypothetical protein